MGYQYGISIWDIHGSRDTIYTMGIQQTRYTMIYREKPDIRESNMAGKSPWPKNFEVFVWKNSTTNSVPLCTQWFCWSLSLLNGYFIGNIPYFQTNQFFPIETDTFTVIAGWLLFLLHVFAYVFGWFCNSSQPIEQILTTMLWLPWLEQWVLILLSQPSRGCWRTPNSRHFADFSQWNRQRLP